MWDVKEAIKKRNAKISKGFISTMWDVKNVHAGINPDGKIVLSRLCGM